MNKTLFTAIAVLCLTACGSLEEELQPGEEAQATSLLTTAQKRARSDTLKAQAATRGITNALVYAGIAHHESGLAQCHSEATWTCPGPASSDCGGGAVLAGAYDGSCALQQGGIGMFIRGGGDRLYSVSQVAPNSGWSSWVDLGGGVTSEPAVGVNTDGSLVVFVRGNDNGVWFRKLGAAGWSAWGTLGGAITSNPTVGRQQDGSLAVFARGGSGSMYLIRQRGPSSDLWNGWEVLSDTASRF